MASVVTGGRDAIDAVRQGFGWTDPVLVAWMITVGAVLLGAEVFNQDYDMLVATLRIIFYFTLFELVIGIPDAKTDTPNTGQLSACSPHSGGDWGSPSRWPPARSPAT